MICILFSLAIQVLFPAFIPTAPIASAPKFEVAEKVKTVSHEGGACTTLQHSFGLLVVISCLQ